MQATVHLDTQHNVGAIDRRVFGGFLEHLGRAVYEGVFDPGNPTSDEEGFRRDVLDALRAMGMSVMRYPGGNFVSCYDWKDGIGPRQRRPSRPDFAWKSIETNQFGLDEFMAWCRKLGTEPMMAINLGTGSIADAAGIVEYCNLRGGTYWADRRRENGHAEPYGVKLWCLGNEMDGQWQAGHVPADVYAQRAAGASILMKGLDPTVQTVVCGSSHRGMKTYMEWDRTVLEYCWDHVDYISAHRYSSNRRNDSAWFLAEGVEIDRILEDYAGLLGYVRALKRSSKRVYLSFDEWNVWYKNSEGDGRWTRAPHLIEEVYNLEDALVCAQYLNAFIRRADVVKVACIAQIVNVIAPILTRREGLLIQSIYYPFLLFSQGAAGLSLLPVVKAPTYKAGERGDVPALDASVSFDPHGGTCGIFLVNRNAGEELTVGIDIADRKFTRVLSADVMGGRDLKAANTWDNPNTVRPAKGKAMAGGDGGLSVTIPAPGLAVVRAQTAGR
jgi:alpha-N-arabinofuranosidase